jgi:hypothetical protein
MARYAFETERHERAKCAHFCMRTTKWVNVPLVNCERDCGTKGAVWSSMSHSASRPNSPFCTIPFAGVLSVFLGCSLLACSAQLTAVDGEAADELTSASTAFCPAGFAYAPQSRQCENATEMIGPFPQTMIDSCKAQGGGPDCEGSRWARDFARGIRKTGTCPPGASLDSTLGYCADATSAFGPFSKTDVARCKSNGGGTTICETNRWAKGLLPRTATSTNGSRSGAALPVPYLNQYEDATINPGGSCGNTSAAMVLAYYGGRKGPDGVRGAYAGGGQCGGAEAWQCPEGLGSILRTEGLFAKTSRTASRTTVKRQIDAGRPVIVHGYFTSVGHIMVVVGYDDEKREWIVNDPAGRWCGGVGGGYASCGGDYDSGKSRRYTYGALSDAVIGVDGDIWMTAASRTDFSL